jgi:hypothetical protein
MQDKSFVERFAGVSTDERDALVGRTLGGLLGFPPVAA